MGTVSLSKQNRLFWLGRYTERVYTTTQFLLEQYDRLIGGEEIDYAAICANLGIPCIYESGEDFCRRLTFDPTDPNSVMSSVNYMLGNGMVLRETISTPTLAYLQMASNAIDLASKSSGPYIELQWMMDDIMAFRGSFDDSVDAESARSITKAGGMMERISLMLRLGWHTERLDGELRKLYTRIGRTDLTVSESSYEKLKQIMEEGASVEKAELLGIVESLFLL